jgi:hypothetical protein
LSSKGRAGLIVPTGIATDSFNQHFFSDLMRSGTLASLYDFENSDAIFLAVHRSYKFCLLTLTGSGTPRAEFAFFCTSARHLQDATRRFTLAADDIALLNPNTRTCPVFRTRVDAELTKAIYRRVPVLVNEATGDDPWGFKGLLMFMMNTASGLFRTCKQLEGDGWALDGNVFQKGDKAYLPLYEAKLLNQYDHRWATYDGAETRDLTAAEKADPCMTVLPRYWVPQDEVEARLTGRWERGWLLGFRNIARNTDERTAIFGVLPRVAVGNSAPIVLLSPQISAQLAACLVGNLSGLSFDYVARQKIGGTNMNFFYINQFAVLPPVAYTPEDLAYIAPRVLELVYTAWDMQPFARDLGYGGPPFRWDEERRALLRAELDAYYAGLYGLTRKQLRYILNPHDLTDRELEDILDPTEDPLDAPRTKDFPGETFRVLKERETKQYGEYRTKRLVLEA